MKTFILIFESRKLEHVILFNSDLSKSQLKKGILTNGVRLKEEPILNRMRYKTTKVTKYLEFKVDLNGGNIDRRILERDSYNNDLLGFRYGRSSKYSLPKLKNFYLKEFTDNALLLLFECMDGDSLCDILLDYDFKEEN